MTDPFGTDRLRQAVLAAWSAQPGRFREDANAEEDHARGGYRDRVVVELAQNAADAAARDGAPGSLLLRLVDRGDGGALLAANTGAPLDADGVASLASLRASAKRDPVPSSGTASSGTVSSGTATVGRFGVGFAAVRSVADDVALHSRAGTVHFSLARTRDAVTREPALATEVARRAGVLPALRLPWPGPPAEGVPGAADLVGPDGRPRTPWATVVVLRLRDAAAVRAVRDQLGAVGDPLLLALPGLDAVVVEVDGRARTLRDVGERWVVATRTGSVPPALLADRPVEERARTTWSVTWAVPRALPPGLPPGPTRPGTVAPAWPLVVHAPTPTDEPCTVPALLLATLPLDPSRRRVVPGPLAEALVEEAGRTWADLLLACHRDEAAGAPGALDLVPTGLPAGTLDAAVRAAVLGASAGVPVLVPADGGPPIAPHEAAVLAGPAGDDRALLAVLGRRVPRLVAAAPHLRAALRAVGVEELDVADVVEALPPLEPAEHRGLLDAAAAAGPALLEALATLLVPLADGRHVRGARGLTVLDVPVDDDVRDHLTAWGLRVVHPRAAHPLHERLGAERLAVTDLLRHPVLRGHVLTGDDEEVTAGVLLALLEQVTADGGAPHPEPWWGELLLPADDGRPAPARGLVLPGTDAARWFDPDVLPPVADDVARHWGRVLPVVGVRTGLTVLDVPEEAYEADATTPVDPADVPPDDLALVLDGLDGWEDYLDEVRPATGAQRAVADLDAVLPDVWPQVLRLLAATARPALLDPVRDADGRPCPTYAAWWLRTRAALGLERPFGSGVADAGPNLLGALLPPPPAAVVGLDVELLRALGGVSAPEDLDADTWAELLGGLPLDDDVDLALAVAVWRALARLALRDPDLILEVDRLPALVADGAARTVPAGDVVVVTLAEAQHPAARPAVVVPAPAVGALADALDVDVAADRFDPCVDDDGTRSPVPDAVRTVFPEAPASWVQHDDLRVDGAAVTWWVDGGPSGATGGEGDPVVHAGTTEGLADGLAQVVGRRHRDRIARLLADPGELGAVLLETAVEDLPER